jgi:hypothetical protein
LQITCPTKTTGGSALKVDVWPKRLVPVDVGLAPKMLPVVPVVPNPSVNNHNNNNHLIFNIVYYHQKHWL